MTDQTRVDDSAQPRPQWEPRRQWDRHSKRAVAAGLDAILDGLGVGHGSRWRQRTVELPAGAHRPDLLAVSPEGVVVHVEVQQSPDPDMAARMAEYAVRLGRAAPFRDVLTDLLQVVVQVTGPPMTVDYRLGRLSNNVHLVHVPTMSWQAYRLASPLAPFALVAGGSDMVEPVIAAIVAEQDADVRASMTALAFYLAPDLTDTLVDALGRVGMTDIIDVVRETEFGRGLLAEGREHGLHEGLTQGLNQGLAQGLDQGISRGLDQGERDTLARLLAARFPGAHPTRVQATVARLLAEHGHDAAGAVLAVDELDPSPTP